MASTKEKSPFLPPRWVIRSAWKIHKALYQWSGGRFGLRPPKPGGYGLASLTTIGRRTGLERQVMIGYFEDGTDLVTMAMNGWGAPEPAWWLNLQAQPQATLVLPGNETRQVVAAPHQEMSATVFGISGELSIRVSRAMRPAVQLKLPW